MGCWQGGEALPTPQAFHPNLADLNIPHSGSAWTDRYPLTLLYAAPHQYKTTDWEGHNLFAPGKRDPSVPASQSYPSGIRAGAGCDTGLCDHGLRGAPRARPCTDAPSGVKNKGKGEHSHPCQHTAFSLVLL